LQWHLEGACKGYTFAMALMGSLHRTRIRKGGAVCVCVCVWAVWRCVGVQDRAGFRASEGAHSLLGSLSLCVLNLCSTLNWLRALAHGVHTGTGGLGASTGAWCACTQLRCKHSRECSAACVRQCLHTGRVVDRRPPPCVEECNQGALGWLELL